MAAKGDFSETEGDDDQRITDIAMQSACKSAGSKRNLGTGKVSGLELCCNTKGNQFGKGGKDPHRGGKNSWPKDEGTHEERVKTREDT